MIAKSINKTFLLQLVKFGTTSAALLVAKLLLTRLFLLFENALVAYALTHAVIFFASYFGHSYVTFRQRIGRDHLWRFFRAVILLKVLDYLIFSLLFVYWDIHSSWAIISATLIVGFIRFFTIRTALLRNKT